MTNKAMFMAWDSIIFVFFLPRKLSCHISIHIWKHIILISTSMTAFLSTVLQPSFDFMIFGILRRRESLID